MTAPRFTVVMATYGRGRHILPSVRSVLGQSLAEFELLVVGDACTDETAAVVGAVAPKPVNVLIGWPSIMSVQDVAALGVRRISVGGSLARAAWGGFMRAARQIAEGGSFGGFCDAAPAADLNAFFREDRKKRPSS